MKDCITNGTCIIFDPRYNKPLDPELLANYKKIIFCDYELSDELSDKLFKAYENDNNYDIWKKILFVGGSDFNQPLNNSLKKCSVLSHINFGHCFNQPLLNSLVVCTALTHIVFGWRFNQPIANSLVVCTALTHIVFGWRFNQPLANFLDNCTSLSHLGICFDFNQKLDLPFNIRSLYLNSNNGNYGDHLSDNIEEIELGYGFNLELDNLPSSIKKITFDKNSRYNKKLNCLPDGLLILELPHDYDKQISSIPSALSKLICSANYKFIEDFASVQVETY